MIAGMIEVSNVALSIAPRELRRCHHGRRVPAVQRIGQAVDRSPARWLTREDVRPNPLARCSVQGLGGGRVCAGVVRVARWRDLHRWYPSCYATALAYLLASP